MKEDKNEKLTVSTTKPASLTIKLSSNHFFFILNLRSLFCALSSISSRLNQLVNSLNRVSVNVSWIKTTILFLKY
jgi:hypothetical protein